MLYYSTNKQSPIADFKEATINGQAPDKGLYFPETIPSLPAGLIDNINNYSKEEIALGVIQPYVGDTIPAAILRDIITATIHFDFPLVAVKDDVYSLELFHGPTLAFKDVGARFMSRCLGYFVQGLNKHVTVLVATSGDTGGAVADGFYEVDGINVVILYPSGKVSSIQELQLTTHGKNITAIEVDGNFDDCQHMVKQAFADKQLNDNLFLTSANSINIARWLPQQFYYFYAYQQWHNKQAPPVISVPSGNFGNIAAGLLAHASGLPVQHFIAACNANDVVPTYLVHGNYAPKQSIPTMSNAMDVGNPSNFARILEIYKHDHAAFKNAVTAYSISDDETRETIRGVHKAYQYLLDPHGAVAYKALENYLETNMGEKGLIMETAHPLKFYDVVEPIIRQNITTPESVEELLTKKKSSIAMKPDFDVLKSYLLS